MTRYESKSYSHLTIILTLIPVTPMNKGFYKNRNFRVVYQIYVW